jgi:hypothetical protein
MTYSFLISWRRLTVDSSGMLQLWLSLWLGPTENRPTAKRIWSKNAMRNTNDARRSINRLMGAPISGFGGFLLHIRDCHLASIRRCISLDIEYKLSNAKGFGTAR